MYNDTNSNNTDLGIGIPDRKKILYEVVLITFTGIVIYITIALLQHSWRKSKCRHRHHNFKKDAIQKRSHTSVTSDSSTSRGNTTGRPKLIAARNGLILRVMCLLSAFLSLSRMAVDQIEIAPPKNARISCRNYQVCKANLLFNICSHAVLLSSYNN